MIFDLIPIPKRKFNNIDAKMADKRIKYCPKCKLCWQKLEKPMGGGVDYFNDFPTYGKEKKVCMDCK